MYSRTLFQRSGRPFAGVLLLAVSMLTACDDALGPDDDTDAVASVLIAPAAGVDTGVLVVGDTVRLVATARSASGSVITGRAVTWHTSAAAVATVDAQGLVRAVGAGPVGIEARVDGRTAVRSYAVVAPPEEPQVIAEVRVEPTALIIQRGGSRGMTARAFDAQGIEIHGRDVQWSTSAPAVVSLTQAGLLVALASGYAEILATIDGVTGAATVTVPTPEPVAHVIITPSTATAWVGGTRQLVAATLATTGGTLSGRTVSWHSQNPAVATVDENGVVKGIARGTARIVATSEGVSGVATVTVYDVPSGSVHAFRLDGDSNLRGAPVNIGSTNWTDDDGVTRRVARFVESGSFTLDIAAGRYRQVMEIALYDEQSFTRVATVTAVDEGVWYYTYYGEGYQLRSDDASLPLTTLQPIAPGEMSMSRSIAGSGNVTWIWVLHQ